MSNALVALILCSEIGCGKKAIEKGLDIAYFFENGVPQAILGDVTRLRQIILNLLSNAIKFTEKGEIILEVRVEGGKPMAEGINFILHFSVKDSGLGIPPDRMNRLFQSFSQVDASTARKFGGTGLGLAISKRLSEMMGGRMWAESTGIPGQGATFHFTLVTTSAEPPTPRRDLRGDQPQLTGKRALVVDDNDTNRRIVTLQLQKWGILSRDTALAAEALKWLEQGESFDVAILDRHMPEMDGLELVRPIGGERSVDRTRLFVEHDERVVVDASDVRVHAPVLVGLRQPRVVAVVELLVVHREAAALRAVVAHEALLQEAVLPQVVVEAVRAAEPAGPVGHRAAPVVDESSHLVLTGTPPLNHLDEHSRASNSLAGRFGRSGLDASQRGHGSLSPSRGLGLP